MRGGGEQQGMMEVVRQCLHKEPSQRPTAAQLLKHRWFAHCDSSHQCRCLLKDLVAAVPSLGDRASVVRPPARPPYPRCTASRAPSKPSLPAHAGQATCSASSFWEEGLKPTASLCRMSSLGVPLLGGMGGRDGIPAEIQGAAASCLRLAVLLHGVCHLTALVKGLALHMLSDRAVARLAVCVRCCY